MSPQGFLIRSERDREEVFRALRVRQLPRDPSARRAGARYEDEETGASWEGPLPPTGPARLVVHTQVGGAEAHLDTLGPRLEVFDTASR